MRTSACCLAILACVALTMPPAVHAASFTVDDAGDDPDADTSDGACATTLDVCTLRAALEQANAIAGESHTIALPAGHYGPTTAYPSVVQDVTVNGAGANVTVIESAAPGHPRLFDVPAGGSLGLHDLSLTGAGVGPGSALRASGGAVTITDCSIFLNTGGAVQAAAPSPLGSPVTISVTNTSFLNNTVGPALEVGSSYSLVLEGGTFEDNQQATNQLGGAIAITSGGSGRSQSISGATFMGNLAASGGALSIDGVSGTVAIAQSTFTGNLAQLGSFGGGGAIYSVKPGVTITGTTFDDNHATGSGYNGGAIFSPGIAFTCTGCTFSGNTTSGTGGAICATGMTLVNSTFYANGAGTSGGGIYVDVPGQPNALRAANLTVVGNSAAAGGGIRGGSASVVVKNSLVAANSAPTGPDCVGTITSQGYNLVGNGSACGLVATTGDQVGSAGTPIDPRVDVFADYGGPTKTVGLLGDSPAIDGGNPTGCTDFASAPLPNDQRGSARPTDGDGIGGAVCDIGAFEAPAAAPTTTSTTLPGATTSTTTTTIGGATTTSIVPTTSTTLPAPVCVGGVAIDRAVLIMKHLSPPSGNEVLVFRGVLMVPSGTPAFFEPEATGAQLLIENLGDGGAAIFELSHRTTPIPGGGGCGARDGWKRLRYTNASGSIDPPACTPSSANGLRSLRFKDRRAKGKGIAFVVVAKRAELGAALGPFRGTVVLAASVTSSLVGECGVRTFTASDCRAKATKPIGLTPSFTESVRCR
jgi:predicted outer membrane repeat protein